MHSPPPPVPASAVASPRGLMGQLDRAATVLVAIATRLAAETTGEAAPC
jgi:hypothetical protein